jgi:serine/threonine kinase 16
MIILVLYRIEEIRGGEWWCEERYNAFEAPLVIDSDRAIVLGDLLQFIAGNDVLRSAIGNRYAFFAEIMGRIVPLTSPAHILPVSTSNTLKLRLRPTIPSLINGVSESMTVIMTMSKDNLAHILGKRISSSNSSSQFVSTPVTNSIDSSSSSLPNSHPSPDADSRLNRSNSASTNAASLNTYVGDDAAAVITDAAEVAKEAAKSLFGFAATWGKSVLDAASTVSATALTGSASGRLSGPITLGKMRVQVVRELSEGGFGIVYVAQEGTKSYALKQLICQSKAQLDEARTEIENLQLLRGHPNIIELIDYGSATPPDQPRQFFLLFPLYRIGTAWEAIERASIGIDPASRAGPPWPFPEARAIRVALCAAKALEYMHRKGLSHRDVKPHNILLSEVSEDKHVLMDFGSVSAAKVAINSRSDALTAEDEASQKTSMAYRPPELTSVPFPPCVLDERIDVWSLGCTMFCLAFGRSPFETAKDGVQKLAILNGRWQPPPDLRMRDCIFQSRYVSLIEEMLQLDWNRRPFMKDVIVKLQNFL